ncbi:MAG TPA: hypothetical protein PK156_31145 [Polyangium sp.]|nr:hypothetical protein [Polyangium sp.]
MKLPPKPRTPPIVARALMAMSLGIPACGGGGAAHPDYVPSRIGPPPCENYAGWRGAVVGMNGQTLANVEVTLTMGGQTRVYTTDAYGRFSVGGSPGEDVVGPASATIAGHVVNGVDVYGGSCMSPKTLTVRVDGNDQPGKNGIVLHD